MKKLMIAAAIVCAAAYVQAGALKWSSTSYGTDAGTGELYLSDGVTKVSSGTVVYLFNAATLSEDSLIKGLRAAESASDYWSGLASGTILDQTTVNASSKIATKTTPQPLAESGTSINLYYAMLVGDEVLISSERTNIAVPAGTTGTVDAKWNTTGSVFSKVNKGSADWTTGGEGWYSVVPEPTSGLLLLLGVAGLALRRRRA